MWRGVRWYLVGCLVLVALAGCGRGFLQYAEREKWRREAEVACLNSGTVREGAGVVRVEPIEGPGICGADFPLKVALLGDSAPLGYADEPIRPPGAIPGAPAASPPWPLAGPPPRQGSQRRVPARSGEMPARRDPPTTPDAPLSIHPPEVDADARDPRAQRPRLSPASASPTAPAQSLPPLGPPRAAPAAGVSAVEVKPAATLACPIVSALDQWIANAVQPAALKWFGRPVVEIRQISAYSCRGMNGQPGARISEHAFGNALDIAAFVLADGHRVTVKDGWRGTPEEQGFLRDVQGAACDQFTTVLAPGSNAFHYDHIHVDLMRRPSGRRICEPGAIEGELIAARARRNPALAARHAVPPTRRYDPPFDGRDDPFAWRGDARRGDPATTGSIDPRRPLARNPAEDDNDWVEDPGPRPPIDWNGDRHRPL
jgi:hypothetical protein